ncbi:MAG: hypothetical protein HZC28_16290 [Spirochaetes bacterium]|nr:hypothetical protein [Spirochaetota bacterium]
MKTIALVILIAAFVFGASPDEKGFIRDWLVSGPYPSYTKNDKDAGIDTDFFDGEARIAPYPGLAAQAEFIADKGKLIAGIGSANEWGLIETRTVDTTWKAVHSDTSSLASFEDGYGPFKDHFVLYAVCYIESPKDRKIKIRVGSDDDHKIYLNDRLVGKQFSAQAIVPDNFIYTAELHQGMNRLVFKLADRIYGSGFCVALSDESDAPLTDVHVYTDHPARQFGAEQYCNGFAASFEFAEKEVFSGANKLSVTVFPPDRGEYRYRCNGVASSARSFQVDITLAEGEQKITVEVLNNAGTVTSLTKRMRVYSRETLRKENSELEARLKELTKNVALAEEEGRRYTDDVTRAALTLSNAYAAREKHYAAERAAAVAAGTKSIDEPMTAVTTRSRLCLNGVWEASADRKKWLAFQLPQEQMDRYFRTSRYPVTNAGKSPYGEVGPVKGWEDFTLSPIVISYKTWFRKMINIPAGRTAFFVCNNIKGMVKVYLNGAQCGEYNGFIGIVEMKLTNAVPGENILELYVERVDNPMMKGSHGIAGDMYLESTDAVRVADVWVKTGFRNGSLVTTAEIENHSDKSRTITVNQYAAERGRIRFRLPAQERTIDANTRIEVKNRGIWADPELWGIGGAYGNPTMYDLVSEISVDGTIVDRHVQPFGFREFWIHATDFYLNGKRIILQGDVGTAHVSIGKVRDIMLPLLRRDGINIVRLHDTDYWDPEVPRACDRLGMLTYAQCYPVLHEGKPDPKKFTTVEQWLAHPLHQYNIENYRRWFRMCRNNPSVVIWSTDNEILTQSWDTAANAEFNVRNDKLGAIYGKLTKSFDPDMVMTRNGDIGTQTKKGRWFEDPPCDTANYHYPDFNTASWVVNWQRVYEFRPVIFGETLYYSYGAWDNWIGPIPSQVQKKAAKVRSIASLYRELEVPAPIFMGLSHDGFTGFDNTGNGNVWGITADMFAAYVSNTTLPAGLRADQYPWYRIPWPAYSGRGAKAVGTKIGINRAGNDVLNWFDGSRPSHVRNAVNDAYRESLIPQPPLAPATDAECILKTAPESPVWSISATGETYGVVADTNGRAWFQFSSPGVYRFEADGVVRSIPVPGKTAYAEKPGFDGIPVLSMREER